MIRLSVPGSKSMTHRAFILAANAPRACWVENALESLDTDATRLALIQLGARFERHGFGTFRSEPAALSVPAGGPIDCRNSGTTLRLLLGQAARLSGQTAFDGDSSLRQRPNRDLIRALEDLGARSDSDQFIPLTLMGPIQAGKVVVTDPKSSQFISSLLLSLVMLPGTSRLEVEGRLLSKPYVSLTLTMLREAGIEIVVAEDAGATVFTIHGGQVLNCERIFVEGDWSTAAFPVVASIASGIPVALGGLNANSVQADRALERFILQLGHGAAWSHDRFEVAPGSAAQDGVVLDLADCPDLFPALCALAALGGGGVSLRGAPQLRLKESDRIALMAAGLKNMGCVVHEHPDGLDIGSGPSRPSSVKTERDHRVLMAFELLNIKQPGIACPDGLGAEAVSYPDFYKDMRQFGLS